MKNAFGSTRVYIDAIDDTQEEEHPAVENVQTMWSARSPTSRRWRRGFCLAMRHLRLEPRLTF
jgi:hypothetical protein